MNNLTSIKAMYSWVKTNGKSPAPENYIDIYLNKVGLKNVVEDDTNYEPADKVLDYTKEDMEDEIAMLDFVNDYSFTEDVEHLEDWGIKSQLES
jgi:hypothetical protein